MALAKSHKTARLTLRPVAASDEAAVVTGIDDIAVSGWLSTVPYPYSTGDFRFFLDEIAKPGETFVIEDQSGFVGILGLEGGELGYWLVPNAHGQGYATEACRIALRDYFENGAGSIIAGYFEGNLRSARVLHKLGFVETERRSRHCAALGADRPHVDLILNRESFV